MLASPSPLSFALPLAKYPAAPPLRHNCQVSWTLAKLLDALLGSEHKVGRSNPQPAVVGSRAASPTTPETPRSHPASQPAVARLALPEGAPTAAACCPAHHTTHPANRPHPPNPHTLTQVMFRRTQLKALVDMHGADEGLGGNLTGDEVKVICGALDLTSKTARRWAEKDPALGWRGV